MYAEIGSLPLGLSFRSLFCFFMIGLAVPKGGSSVSKQLDVCTSMSWIVRSTSQASCLFGKIGVSSSILPLSLAVKEF